MKYKLTTTSWVFKGVTLYRIEALRDIPEHNVRAGDRGGWIQGTGNLSQYHSCWVAEWAKVYESAYVYDDALIGDEAEVYGNAKISGNARILGEVNVYGRAEVGGAITLTGIRHVNGDQRVDSSSGCLHEYVNVGFNHIILACKYCGESKE